MIVLKDILYRIPIEKTIGSTGVAVRNIEFDSRNVGLNDVFVAIKGTVADGHDYILKASEQGALVIICETLPKTIINGITYIQVADTHKALALLAANYYENPSEKLKLVGITGTNGKTTISTLLYDLFAAAGHKTGLISTVKVMVDDTRYEAKRTTPDSLTINQYLQEMVEAGVEYCFMEVSSHGIHQKRTEGLHFAGGIFTNLTHEHLDYHKNFKEYRDVKKQFFDQLPKTAFALTNGDDKNGGFMLQNTRAKKYTYALKTHADYKAQILENNFTGLLLKINNNEIWVKLIGTFNAYNMLAIFGAADILGMETMKLLQLMSTLNSVDGRFQYMVSEKKITAIVDYAHSPDALKNVLQTINSIRTGNEDLITVVGCGGDRDATKRPIMGKIAATLSTKVVFTSDNPRTENPDKIIEEVEAGVPAEHFKKTVSITNRKQAIKSACQMANENDIILIAGKGHETYQEINGERIDFDDFKIVTEFLTALDK
ncbi:UDP-N-acetylmuramoyl-L-alanyl-D-glutamate--2,6-diaminopimelate ligase [Marixanthomonas spongiae]|uniref:UDP-N-acetylmuramoyl-L-alanyl-D-glutamate--2,6-diaminopimelate ligase n=1 Tax=Marixanthomonas spongiae TaxID=2174845 RepID=A0A2U0I7L1_9FLAO|nr:UDP-N-acetylmuramoyl-L-alanyl-D-glutamate--2,6-diaminopimelate ligase [Marixanthomonas spongiae]PVW17081.1 UDP-N-acetylmuramoyl-L-alanyl-D-glutamate--2,6-diaminopimelate ligase [Marixanthomonas spongiae]